MSISLTRSGPIECSIIPRRTPQTPPAHLHGAFSRRPPTSSSTAHADARSVMPLTARCGCSASVNTRPSLRQPQSQSTTDRQRAAHRHRLSAPLHSATLNRGRMAGEGRQCGCGLNGFAVGRALTDCAVCLPFPSAAPHSRALCRTLACLAPTHCATLHWLTIQRHLSISPFCPTHR